MKRLIGDLGFATAGLLGWIVTLPFRIRPNDREALALALFAWVFLLVGLVALFPVIER